VAEGAQRRDPLDPLGQSPPHQHRTLAVDELDVMVTLGPVVTHEQHPISFLLQLVWLSAAWRRQPAI
jgi:hypothetical protein